MIMQLLALQIRRERELSRFHYRCTRKEGNMRDNGKKHCLFYLLKYQPVDVGILMKERKESSRTSTNKLKIFTIQAE